MSKTTRNDCSNFGANEAHMTSAVTKVRFVWEVTPFTIKLAKVMGTASSAVEFINLMRS